MQLQPDQRHAAIRSSTRFVADGASHVGDPTDAGESERIEWVPVDEVRRIVRDNEMIDGLSLTAVAYALAFGALE